MFFSFKLCALRRSPTLVFSFRVTEIISKVHCSVVCCINVSLIQVMCSETKSNVGFLIQGD